MNKTIKELAKGNEQSVKLNDIIGSIEAINKLVEQKLPVFTGFQLSVFLKALAPILEAFDAEKIKLAKELGTPELDEDGKETGQIKFEPEPAKEFNDKMLSLLSADLEIKVPVIKISDLGNFDIEPKYLTPLVWLIKE